ncbi:MAG: TlpA family protein disulfide reductase [Fibrobacter sp.]|uniref:TlpA family protein disulfide reductase n=1 Tax=Fibrobacter sp. TaxID=35828 RepID=UPI0025BEA686|nr:TlpA disulfide reductase family protein [Fibrobacter sp.]MBQ9227173.1 TlpA family protein disulfide reductase [Fibrobacter sp.]
MNKKLIITALFALITWAVQAKEKVIVWEQPTTEYGTSYGDGYFNLALDVTKVELKADETVVYITAHQRSDYPDFSFQFAGDTYLKVGDRRYTITSADNIELNKFVQTNKDGKRDMAFHFPPLPQGTTSFDFIEGDGQNAFQIKGIKPVEERWKQLFPSYWRDGQGDWKIAFTEDFAIYDCKFWNYKQRNVNPKANEAEVVMTNGNDELRVKVGKDKKGKRQIQIGNEKALYTMITSRFLPDYPTKDTRTDFVDTGNVTDTVTVVGWLKDMPEQFKRLKTFEFGYENFITDEQESVYADLDSLGRFTVKIPLMNSSEFFCDWRRCFMRTMLEPGKTYFILYDFKEGRRYFMGDDVRLQNEFFKYPLDWQSIRMERGADFDQYIASVDSLIKTQHAFVDNLCQEHPTLSTRFNIYRKGNTLCQQARDFGQARFNSQSYQLSDQARQYAYNTFWTKIEKPYTLHRDLRGFLRDYFDDAAQVHNNGTYSYNIRNHYKEYASNDEELALLTRWAKWIDEVTPIIDAEPTDDAKVRKSHELDSLNADMIKEVDKIFMTPKATKMRNGGLFLNIVKGHLLVLDSLGADPYIKDVWLTRKALDQIDYGRTSLLPSVLDSLKTMIKSSDMLAMIEKHNNHYLAIENREFDRLVLKSSDNLKNLSEGEALLKKLVEPYKGKFVLLDIWGTWCSPCKEALSHFTEEYARLKDFDIQYLYLANRSPQDSWENVIKEYNVSGPNVAHYNLPENQQSAIERHLNVHAFPTYKLFNRNGDLLDLQIDPRDLDALARLLEQMK